MKIRNLHSWEVTGAEARELQTKLAPQVLVSGGKKIPKIVAGCDIGLTKTTAYAGVVLLAFPELEVIDTFTLSGPITFPYIPGLLSFREAPLLLELFRTVTPDPDLIFFDGQGIAHPRRFGLACHMGLFLDAPTIGCAKSRLTGEHDEPGSTRGDHASLRDQKGDVLGAALRTKDNCKPVYVSVGHRIDLDTAIERTLQCGKGYRIPEPTRLAHNLVTALRKEAQRKGEINEGQNREKRSGGL